MARAKCKCPRCEKIYYKNGVADWETKGLLRLYCKICQQRLNSVGGHPYQYNQPKQRKGES